MVKKTAGTSVTSYVYNTEDRLTQVWNGEIDTGSLIAEYYYDPFGRRLWKEVSGVRTHFHYTDEGLIGEHDAGGNEIKTYGYKPGGTWTTDPLFMKKGEQYYFYQNDHLGTPQKLTATNGAVVWSATYSSFGKATVEVEVVENPFRFAGQYYDAETGLHYNWHRYYDPKTGRYLRSDPIGFASGDLNLFAYVQNNPINYVDSLGLAKYNVYWNYESISLGYPVGAAGAKVSGIAISMKKSCEGKCKGMYEAIKFEGYLGGVSVGSPIGGSYNNQEIFEDNYENADVRRVGGMSWVLSGTIAAPKWGKSGGGYQFGELRGTKKDVSDVDQGYDLGVDYVGGSIRTAGDTFCVESPILLQN